ncbi:MAG: hypothetical protein U9N83_13470, partial [Thermodesulfobacteriota bacterium]|nr:hypothetical protein [Thermodesulfobacteriota bacterium]
MKVTSPVLRRGRASNRSFLFGKGTKSDYNGCGDVIGNGQTVSGLQMASKAFTIICDIELGKPNMLPEKPGRDPVRA